MNKHLTDNQIEDLLGKAKAKLTLNASEQIALRSRLMAEISQIPQVSRGWQGSQLGRIPMLAPMLLAAVIAIGSGTAAVANSALPGTPLYPLGQLVEQAQIKLVVSPAAKAQLYADLSQKKVNQLAAIDSQDTSKMTPDQKHRWQKNHTQATAEVAASIEKVAQVQATFQAKLDAATDPKVKDTLRVVTDHIQSAVNDRNQILAHIADQEAARHDDSFGEGQKPPSTSGGSSNLNLDTTSAGEDHTDSDTDLSSHSSLDQGISTPSASGNGSSSGSVSSKVGL